VPFGGSGTLRRGVDPSLSDRITLTVPAASAAVRIARASAAALATRAGFTYREVEELQLAVGEGAALLAPEPDGDGTLCITFELQPDGVRVELHLVDPGSAGGDDRLAALRSVPAADRRAPGLGDIGPGTSSIAAAVLDAAVDSWQVRDGGRRLVLTKRPSDTDDDD
jgi:anti-sigma regulatory factor (Ser/Thr protein kinase)